jgi:hypothetical protein
MRRLLELIILITIIINVSCGGKSYKEAEISDEGVSVRYYKTRCGFRPFATFFADEITEQEVAERYVYYKVYYRLGRYVSDTFALCNITALTYDPVLPLISMPL